MADAIYCYDTASVRFAIHPGGRRVLAEIEEDALRDHFGVRGGGDALVEAYFSNADHINAIAMQRHDESPGKPILLTLSDFRAAASRSLLARSLACG